MIIIWNCPMVWIMSSNTVAVVLQKGVLLSNIEEIKNKLLLFRIYTENVKSLVPLLQMKETALFSVLFLQEIN